MLVYKASFLKYVNFEFIGMSKDVVHKKCPGSQQSKSLTINRSNSQDDKKTLVKKGWLQKDSSFNKTEKDNNCNAEVISRSINKFLKNEKKSRPTANPTKVCLKPEVFQESKEQFAQRIRQAWIDREQSKSCINIYLARNVIEDPLMEATNEVQESAIEEQEVDSCRTALEVQLQNHVGESEISPDDSSEEEKPLSAAARRVRFYKTAKQQNDIQTLTRAMSAPTSRQQSVYPTQEHYLTNSRRKSQEIHKFPTRKLKSSRSKAFHKSINVDSRLPSGPKFGKKNQNVEVVTMMSLLSPVGSDVEESTTPDDVSTKTVTFPQFNNSMRYHHQKSFDSAMKSMGKPKLLNNRVGKSLIKSKTLELSRDEEDIDGEVVKEDEIPERDNKRQENEIAEIAVRYDVVDGQPTLKSDKEKECWALFKKMTAKGVSVTFDTVLRGMLTPTEYRLRKNELLLFGWRGSVYKLVWRELAAYLIVYFALNLAYRFAFTEAQQKLFIKIRCYLAGHSASVPLTFAMSFYVGLVVKRWWEQYRLLPWPDTLALFVSAAIPGTTDERGRLMRRNIVRYAVLAYVITLKQVSIRVKKRFPTLQHIVDAGLMMDSEKEILETVEAKTAMTNYWIPLTWATNIINRARREKLISNDHMVQTILLEMSDMRYRLGSLIGYDNVNIPILYSQVVTLSLYAYFGAQLVGAQMIEPPPEWGFKDFKEFDLYIPLLTIIEFCFFVGWLKVAEVLIGPFGEDDDDIELNWLIDRHIKAAYMIVDEMHEEHPELLKDQYWDEVVPKDLPYTVASEHYRREEPKGSADKYKVKESDSLYANMAPVNHMHCRKSAVPEDMYADYESVDTPMAERRKNWFQRQIHRVGSIRSSSTTYSSGGLFNRTRHNSVYSSPENGLPVAPGLNGHLNCINGSTPHLQKITLYDRLWGRKSMKSRRGSTQGSNKINGQMNARGRPRIPTPDVQKDGVIDKDSKQNISGNGTVQPGTYPPDIPAVVQVLLSPIQEMDAANLSGTLHNQRRGVVNVSQGVLNPAFSTATVYTTRPMSVSVSPIALSTVSMSQPLLSSLGITTSTDGATTPPPPPLITDVSGGTAATTAGSATHHSDKDDSACGGSSSGSVSSTDDRKTPACNRRKRGEVYV